MSGGLTQHDGPMCKQHRRRVAIPEAAGTALKHHGVFETDPAPRNRNTFLRNRAIAG